MNEYDDGLLHQVCSDLLAYMHAISFDQVNVVGTCVFLESVLAFVFFLINAEYNFF